MLVSTEEYFHFPDEELKSEKFSDLFQVHSSRQKDEQDYKAILADSYMYFGSISYSHLTVLKVQI